MAHVKIVQIHLCGYFHSTWVSVRPLGLGLGPGRDNLLNFTLNIPCLLSFESLRDVLVYNTFETILDKT